MTPTPLLPPMNLTPLDPTRSLLVLVDYQQRLLPAIHQGEAVAAEALRLAEIAHRLGVPVIGTEQNPDRLGPNLPALREHCRHTLAKSHFDACEDGLLDAIARLMGTVPGEPCGALDLVFAGCEAHVCLLQTVLGALRAGHRCVVIAGACGSRRAEDKALGLQRLQAAGTIVASLEMIAFEWLRSHHHPQFRAVQALIKSAPLA